MTNILITLPTDVKQKIEEDAQKKYEAFFWNNQATEKNWTDLYKETESTKWFLIERHKNSQKELIDGYEELLKTQEDFINELKTQVELYKRQVK